MGGAVLVLARVQSLRSVSYPAARSPQISTTPQKPPIETPTGEARSIVAGTCLSTVRREDGIEAEMSDTGVRRETRGVPLVGSVRDRNVYILGAGFSAAAGVPIVHDFIERSRIYFDDPSSGLDDAEREHFKRFLDFKRKMSQAREKVRIDLDDIEQLFGLEVIS